MSKIVVTTDLSANSKKGIHFAMQLASQTECELIFYTVIEIFRPSIWDNVYYEQFETDEIIRNQQVLEKFIHEIYQKSNQKKTNYKCVCEVGINSSDQIISYAKSVDADYICVSTIGAGNLKQLFGTIASKIATFSPIPVIVVPKNYKSKPIATICFASDLVNLEEELRNVSNFATPVHAKINILHYDYQVHLEAKKNKLSKLIAKYETKNTKFYTKKLDPLYPLTSHMQMDIQKMKPSLLAFFTKQNRNWFDRLFVSSITSEMIYDTKTPILVFRKHIK
jgi:nucleotide-binding universal stress UspA family protein